MLIDACEILKEKQLRFECHFVGSWVDISGEQFNSDIERKGLTGYVFGHGGKYKEAKSEFFEQSDIFVFPTYYHNETFGLVNLEAMQYALPVIATNEGGIGDIVIDKVTGFIIDQQDPDALAAKIEMLIKDPSLACRMGSEGRKRYESLYTISHFENRLNDILQDAISKYSRSVSLNLSEPSVP